MVDLMVRNDVSDTASLVKNTLWSTHHLENRPWLIGFGCIRETGHSIYVLCAVAFSAYLELPIFLSAAEGAKPVSLLGVVHW
jgi:hypothetical protein